MTTRNHHYLSQCYLKGFTSGGTNKHKLSIIDLKEKKFFKTRPRNVGSKRDFNRVGIVGVGQNSVEDAFGEFETMAAASIRQLSETKDFSGNNRDVILNLLAMFAARSPEKREQSRKNYTALAESAMDFHLSSEAQWKRVKEELLDTDPTYDNENEYEEVKKFYDEKKYRVDVPREYHIYMEMKVIDTILPCLFNRNWLLIVSTESIGQFITTDRPISLTWQEPSKIPTPFRYSPGYEFKGTEVYFPITKNLALLGSFDEEGGTIEATENIVAALNRRMISSSVNEQIYAPSFRFKLYNNDDKIVEGGRFFEFINHSIP